MNESPDTIDVALPSGSLWSHTMQLFKEADLIERIPARDEYDIGANAMPGVRFVVLDRIDMMATLLEGRVPIGITGLDYKLDNDLEDELSVIAEYQYARASFNKTRLVLASKPDLITDPQQLKGKRLATELPHLTARRIKELFDLPSIELTPGKKLRLDLSEQVGILKTNGKTETAIRQKRADAISEITETGSSLKKAGLVKIADLQESTPVMIMTEEALKCRAICDVAEQVGTALRFALEKHIAPLAYVTMNVPKKSQEAVFEILDEVAAESPTVQSTDDDSVMVMSVQVPQSGNGIGTLPLFFRELLKAGANNIEDLTTGLSANQSMLLEIEPVEE